MTLSTNVGTDFARESYHALTKPAQQQQAAAQAQLLAKDSEPQIAKYQKLSGASWETRDGKTDVSTSSDVDRATIFSLTSVDLAAAPSKPLTVRVAAGVREQLDHFKKATTDKLMESLETAMRNEYHHIRHVSLFSSRVIDGLNAVLTRLGVPQSEIKDMRERVVAQLKDGNRNNLAEAVKSEVLLKVVGRGA